MINMPEGWTEATVDEIADYVQRGKSPRYVAKSALPVVNQKCIRWNSIEEAHLKYVDPAQWSAWGEERFLRDGDVLWNSTGTGTIGRAVLFRGLQTAKRAVADSHVTIVRPSKAVLGQYLHRFIRSPAVQAKIEAMQSGSTNQVELSKSEILETVVPLAPLPEQRRIVAKIDSLSAKSGRARDHLDHLPRLVEKYKQAVLAAAFRGALTENWRATHPGSSDGRYLREELIRQRGVLETKKRIVELDFEGEQDLPELPPSWTWMPVAGISTNVADGVHKKPEYVEEGVPFLTVRNMTAGPGLSFADCRYVTREDHEEFIKRTHPEKGDILISKDGTLGVVRAIRTDRVFSIFVSVALVKPCDREMTDYLELAFQSPVVQGQMVGVGTGLQHIHLTDLRRDLVPIAPAAERLEIVCIVRRLFSWIDRLAAEATSARKLVDHLDRAVLAKAFWGELVPQDRADEPASVLLERIKAERAAPQRSMGTRGRRSRTA